MQTTFEHVNAVGRVLCSGNAMLGRVLEAGLLHMIVCVYVYVFDMCCRKIQEETLRTYIFSFGSVYDTLRLVAG